MEYDTKGLEVLYSCRVASSDCAQFHKENVKVTSGNNDAKTLLLVIYWDKTSKDERGKFMMHSVYVGVSSVEPACRDSWLGKRHIGFLPIPILNTWSIPDDYTAAKVETVVKQFGRRLYQYALRTMLEPLAYYQYQGLPFMTQENAQILIVPRLFHFSGDLPEAAAAMGVYVSNTKLKQPCHVCHCTIGELCEHNASGKSTFSFRKETDLSNILQSGKQEQGRYNC